MNRKEFYRIAPLSRRRSPLFLPSNKAALCVQLVIARKLGSTQPPAKREKSSAHILFRGATRKSLHSVKDGGENVAAKFEREKF